MIIWLNGAFGAGKMATARELAATMPDVRLFDPEMVGFLLREMLKDHQFSDFQDLPPGAPSSPPSPARSPGSPASIWSRLSPC